MKQCPTCRTPYTDDSLNFCLKDGTPLASGPPSGFDTQPSTLTFPNAHHSTKAIGDERIRALLAAEIDANIKALANYLDAARKRGAGFSQSHIGHAQMLDGFRYNALPNLKREVWSSLLASLPDSDLSSNEVKRVHGFYEQLDQLESLKASIELARKKMDKEREMETLISELLQNGNPLNRSAI